MVFTTGLLERGDDTRSARWTLFVAMSIPCLWSLGRAFGLPTRGRALNPSPLASIGTTCRTSTWFSAVPRRPLVTPVVVGQVCPRKKKGSNRWEHDGIHHGTCVLIWIYKSCTPGCWVVRAVEGIAWVLFHRRRQLMFICTLRHCGP